MSIPPAPTRRPVEGLDKEAFARDGFLVVRNFFDLEKHIRPITSDIQRIVEILCTKYGITRPRPDLFYSGYLELKDANRAYSSEVYDAVKQLGSYMQLLSSEHVLNQVAHASAISGCNCEEWFWNSDR